MSPFRFKNALHLLTTVLPLFLTGCMGVYEGGFECPPAKGMGCKSISEVNDLVNRSQERGDTISPDQTPLSPDSRYWYSPWALREIP